MNESIETPAAYILKEEKLLHAPYQDNIKMNGCTGCSGWETGKYLQGVDGWMHGLKKEKVTVQSRI